MADPTRPPLLLHSCCFPLKSSSTAKQTTLPKLPCLRETPKLSLGLLDEPSTSRELRWAWIDPRRLKLQLRSSKWGRMLVATLVLPIPPLHYCLWPAFDRRNGWLLIIRYDMVMTPLRVIFRYAGPRPRCNPSGKYSIPTDLI